MDEDAEDASVVRLGGRPNPRDILQSMSRVVETPSGLYRDASLVCRDGTVEWSRFLLAANSPFLAECMELAGGDGEDAVVFILPDVTCSTLGSMLRCTLNYAVRRDRLSVNEKQVMNLLGFEFKQSAAEEEPLVHAEVAKRKVEVRIVQEEEEEDDDDGDTVAGSVAASSVSVGGVDREDSESDRREAPPPDEAVFNDIPILSGDIRGDVDAISVMSVDGGDLFVQASARRRADVASRSASALSASNPRPSPPPPPPPPPPSTQDKCVGCDIPDFDCPAPDRKRRKGTAEATFKCTEPNCNMEFVRALHLEQHVSLHRKERELPCDQCGKVFYHEANLRAHQRYHRETESAEECPDCGEKVRGARALKAHMDVHHVTVRCPVCEKEVPKAYVRQHAEKEHPDVESGEALRCDTCSASFKSRQALRVHKGRAHRKVKQSANTKEAKAKELSRDDFVKCKVCSKLFANGDHLEIHLKKKHPDSDKAASCADCGGKPVKDLAAHRRSAHVPPKNEKLLPADCGVCGKTYATAYAAIYHEESVHGQKKVEDEECPVCHKRFRRLKRHMREVHSENRFECPVCGKFFPVRDSLRRHVRNMHQPARIECPFCELEVIHLSAHLTGSHGIKAEEARELVESIAGRESARTDLQWTAFSNQPQKQGAAAATSASHQDD